MVKRRTVLKNGIVLGTAGLVGLTASNTASASSHDGDGLVVNEFGAGYPGANELGEWTGDAAFDDSGVSGGALRLEYDDGGFFATNVFADVSAYDTLEITISGDAGGEEDDIDIRVGDVRDSLASLTSDSIGTSSSTLSIDLADAGVDQSSVELVRLGFWHEGSGAVEIEEIAFVGEGDGSSGGGDYEEITADDTLLDLWPDYEYGGYGDAIEIDEYFPSEISDGDGHGDHSAVNWPDDQKAAHFNVDLDAIRDGARDGSVTFGEMGDVVLDHVNQYLAEGMSRRSIAMLLPRLIMLPHDTEDPTYHQGENWFPETYGPVEATNDPDQLIQDPWPLDARSYDPDEVAIRDRAHDQLHHENMEGWTENDILDDDRYNDPDNPIHLLAEGLHPVTEEPLGGDGFTANAPMEVEARINDEGGFWYQLLQFKNLSNVPYHLNAAVVMWIGPSGQNAGNLRTGHYNNEQRPQPGWGHPQRDVIEVLHDEEKMLSAWAVRIAFHDEPYNMRTAYPNQLWSLEQGMTVPDYYEDDPDARQELVETMVNTCHVEIETDMDRNDDFLDALDMRNRMSN
ncbi:hypothetical protein [Natronobiforma cellulositropha]|uniref:hypothetical protein n=1 Tax=Natronobiforma cellulositropha TaxID=1679076 RepID=UPI0021D5BE60|nr:hypothetical protein [Natronobiforma cellulositropha]